MDDFVARLVADPRIGAQFKDANRANLANDLADTEFLGMRELVQVPERPLPVR